MTKSSQGVQNILKILLRLTVVLVGLIIGFWLVIISSMGPAYLLNVGSGQLDGWIRGAMLVGGGIIVLLSLAYLLWPLGKKVWRLEWLAKEADDSKSDSAIKLGIRALLAVMIAILGYFVAFAATMGPEMGGNLLGSGFDFGLRISVIAIGFGSIAFAIIWLLWPLLRYLWLRIHRHSIR